MKGLIIKDFHVAKKQIVLFSLLILYFVLLGGISSFSVFPIVCASMIPFTAMAYDEHSKWNSLVKMMPYSRTEIVSSKYIFGYLVMIIIAIITLLVKLGYNFYKHQAMTSKYLMIIGFAIIFGSLIMSISLPLMYAFGTEKGRLLLTIFPVIIVVGFLNIDQQHINKILILFKNTQIMTLSFIIISLVINLISIFLSIKIYRAREKKA